MTDPDFSTLGKEKFVRVPPSPSAALRLTPVRHWRSFDGITFEFVASEDEVRASGLVPGEQSYPSARKGSYCVGSHLKLSRLGDGRLRLKINAAPVLAADAGFQRFLGCLLADHRLSLIKGEQA